MNTPFPEQPRTPETPDFPRHPRSRGGGIPAGGIVLAILLLTSILAATHFLHATPPLVHASGGAPTPTPTVASTPAPGQPRPQGSLYMTAPDSLTRIDLKSSNVLWTSQADYPSAPLVIGKTLFFNDQASTGPALEAVDAKTGTLLWSSQAYPNGFLLGARNTLYDSTCTFISTGTSCYIYGINASTGAQLWSYDLSQANAWIALQNGVLYGVSYTSYFALNASTGVPLWQKDLLSYPDQEANMTPIVRGNVLSFASCNTTKQSSGFPGCYLYAFNASTGQEMWHASVAGINPLLVTPTIMGGVVYAATNDGTLYAFKEQSGEQLWTATISGGTSGPLLSGAGTIYVEVIDPDGQTFHVEAFDAATHAPRWGQQMNPTSQMLALVIPLIRHVPSSGGPAAHPFVLEDGLIYFQNGANTVAALNARDGNQVAQYTASGTTLSGFTVVALA